VKRATNSELVKKENGTIFGGRYPSTEKKKTQGEKGKKEMLSRAAESEVHHLTKERAAQAGGAKK